MYLGVIFDSTGTDTKEIEKRMIQTKRIIECLNEIFWSKEITKKGNSTYEAMIKIFYCMELKLGG